LESCKRAIHLCTGDRGTDRAISSWLERHRVEVVGCTDPYEACAFALTHPKPAPDLAVIGADWLAPDELAIVNYFRETWPRVATVVYGSPQVTAGLQATPLTLVCRSGGAIQRLLAGSPDALLDKPLGPTRPQPLSDDGWRPQPEAPPQDVRHVSAREAPLQPPTIQTHDAELLAAELTPRLSRTDEGELGKPASASHNILTAEELAALLEDDKQ
jgi:hypothetical protein